MFKQIKSFLDKQRASQNRANFIENVKFELEHDDCDREFWSEVLEREGAKSEGDPFNVTFKYTDGTTQLGELEAETKYLAVIGIFESARNRTFEDLGEWMETCRFYENTYP